MSPSEPNEPDSQAQTFSIHEPGSVWFVRSGRLDLFVIRTQDNEWVSARRHILSVEPGQVVFGMDGHEGKSVAVIACAIPGTNLLRLSQSKLSAQLGDCSLVAELEPIPALENWVTQLGM